MDPECYWPVLLSMNFRNLRYCSFCLKNLCNIEHICAQRPMIQSLLVTMIPQVRSNLSDTRMQCSCLQGAGQDTTCRPSEERTCWDCGDISMRLCSYSFHCLFILEMVGGLAVQLKDLKFWWTTSGWQVTVLAWRRCFCPNLEQLRLKHLLWLDTLSYFVEPPPAHSDFENPKDHKPSFFGVRICGEVVSKLWLIPPVISSHSLSQFVTICVSHFSQIFPQIFQWIPLSSTNIINLSTSTMWTKPLREVVVDQLPPLTNLHRALEDFGYWWSSCDMSFWRNRLYNYNIL